MAYKYFPYPRWIDADGVIQTGSGPYRHHDKRATGMALVVTFPDADSLLKVISPGNGRPVLWLNRRPGVAADIVLLRLAAKATGKSGLLPGYVLATADYVAAHESLDCKRNRCYPRNADDARRRDMPKWIENSYQGCHLIFGGVKQIPPFIVKVSGIIQYVSLSKLPSVIWKNIKVS